MQKLHNTYVGLYSKIAISLLSLSISSMDLDTGIIDFEIVVAIFFLFVFVLIQVWEIQCQLKRNFKSNPEVTWDINRKQKKNLIAILPKRKTFSIRNKKTKGGTRPFHSFSSMVLNGKHFSIPLFIFSVEWFCVSRANWQKAHTHTHCVRLCFKSA